MTPTEAEINKAIAELVYPDGTITTDSRPDPTPRITIERNHYFTVIVDYCNNWNDLMPLVIEHLSAFWQGMDTGKWTAAYGHLMSPMVEWNENPQLALALCALKVLEAKTKEKSDGL